MNLDVTRQWLHENTRNRFHSPQRVYGLIVSALSEFRSLQPKIAEYLGEDKRRQALLCLHGTLPVVFSGATFNIPVVFWFPQRFPEHSPMAYVTPTRTMVVKVSKHVDERGRVYHPYLADWSDTSTLGDLFRNLIAIFSVEPPHTRVNKELLDQSANLNSGAGVIAEERRQLLESQRQLSSNISVLEKKLNELNEKKAEFPDADKIADVRHVFRGQTPAMEQLFDLAGEIAAIDDTLYVLSKALNDGKLTIGTYMRQVRKLAQQQFLAKALALKIRGLCSLDR
ncbi:suppressor protein stp22 of temperature-sensitive alpha-factor receptor and arginine permease [Coemansia thaxteri]|uniref:Suppressor protein stp22 of temperature-sensitive alpha-factor receptor and arginine permease n=1 Tax=Coemansia thaxteri TaxID=2663907 RepID=A0A9W8BHR3_9FUNG|nr:suppressor protein stp22 of temperature-sensitive alpha-factor receptor and arginine permease [Coemansia thaxteri]